MATNFNPCLVIDIWKSITEDFSSLVVFEGQFPEGDRQLPNDFKTKGYAFLIGAAKSGQLVIFDKHGNTAERYQIHTAPIIHLIHNSTCQYLCTAAADSTIKICRVNPFGREKIIIALSVNPQFFPKQISILESTLLVASEEGVVSMFFFNLEKNGTFLF